MKAQTISFILGLTSLFLLSGCSENDDAQLKAEIKMITSQPSKHDGNLLKDFILREDIHFDRKGLRNLFPEQEKKSKVPPDNATVLERYTLDSLHLLGIIREADTNTALFIAPDAKVYEAKQGDAIGDAKGRIDSITEFVVTIAVPADPSSGAPARTVVLQLKEH